MNTISIAEFLISFLVLSVVGFCVLGWILWLQVPSLAIVFRKYGRLTWAKVSLRNRVPIVDPQRQERTARRIEGDTLYFD